MPSCLARQPSTALPVRQGETKRAARADVRLDPDPPAVALDDLLARGQAQAAPRMVRATLAGTLEGLEDPGEVLATNAHPIVAN